MDVCIIVHTCTDGQPDSPCILKELVSSGAAAQKGEEKRKKKKEPVAQRQEMVSGTLALLNGLSWAALYVSRASAPKGYKVL